MRGKKLLAWLMALTMTFSISVFVYAAEGTDGQTVVTILHTNDMHGRFTADKGVIGVASIAAAKQATPNSLLVDAGDAIHGLPFVTLNKGADAVQLMSMAGYDVWTPGNHDFNYGYKRLLELASANGIDLVSANIMQGENTLLPAVVIKEVAGVKIGFIGLSTPETMYKTAKENIEGLTFDDPIASAKAQVAALKEKNVDVIVALAHLGTDETSKDTSIALAEAVPELDVIIDGHSHSLFTEGKLVNDVLIASTGDYSGNIGFVTITLDQQKKITSTAASVVNAETAAETYPPDADVDALVTQIKAEQDALLGDVIGSTSATLSADRSPGVRTMEMPLGNLVADALLTQTGSDIALTNGGGLRATINEGDITKKDIVACLPFGNYGVTKNVTPAILKEMLENGVSKLPEPDGRFPQIAGFSFAYDVNQPVGSRVYSITYKGAELDLTDNNTQLLLATNDFTGKGGDEYAALENLNIVTEYSALEEIVIAYLQKNTKSYGASEDRIVAGSAPTAVPVIVPVVEIQPVVETPAITVQVTGSVIASDVSFPAGAQAVVDNCYFLNVRKGSGPSYDAFTYLAKGDVITVLDYQNKWIMVDTPKGQGWVYEGYLIIK